MSAAIMPGTGSPSDSFWDRLHLLESRHRDLQNQHEQLTRALDDVSVAMMPSADLRETWKRYCEVITELEQAADKFGHLRPDVL